MDFVVGHPRSGTMLISKLINACGREVAAHELLPALAWSAVHEPSEYYAGHLDERAIHNLLDIYTVRPRPHLHIDCCWKLSYVMKPLLQHFPDSRIVHLTRDPRDNVRSCASLAYTSDLWKHPAYQTDPQRNYWLRWMPEIADPRWQAASELARNCLFWDATHRLVLEALANHPRVFRIRLEDLHDEARLAELHAFLGLPAASSERVHAALAQPVNSMEEARRETAVLRGFEVAVFERWSREDQEALRTICGDTARRLGYELDAARAVP